MATRKAKAYMLDREATTWMYIAMALIRFDQELGINIMCRIVEATSGAEIAGRFGVELEYDAERLVNAAREAYKLGAPDGGLDEREAFMLYELALAWQKRAQAEQREGE